MCVYSNVLDHYDPIIPIPITPIVLSPPSTTPFTPVSPSLLPWQPALDLQELRKLLEEFKAAAEAAKKIDQLTKQPDCEDPVKLKLIERVAELEKRLAEVEAARKEDSSTTFQRELEKLINRTGMDARAEVPDYILAAYLMKNLEALIQLKTSVKTHEGTRPEDEGVAADKD